MDIRTELRHAIALHQQGSVESAVQIYDTILEISPEHPQTLHLRAQVEQQRNNPQAAIEMIAKAMRNAPYSPLMHFDIGLAYQETEHFERAIQSFQTAIQLDPQLTVAVEMLGKTLVKASRFEEAITFYSGLIKQQPNDFQLHKQLGAVFWEQKNLQQAAKSFEEASDLNPKDAAALSNLGAVLHELQNLPAARTALNRAIEINPDFAGAHYNLANVLNELEEHKDAKKHFQYAIDLLPEESDFRSNYVTLLNSLGEFEESARQCRKIIEQDPGYIKAYYSLFTFNAEHVTEEEVAKLDELLADSKIPSRENCQAYSSLGKRYDQLGQFDKAFSCFETANRLDARHDKYDEKKLIEFIDSMITVFQANKNKWEQLQGSETCQPIFILGMPRSGSTLVDQILTSHSQVQGAGEFTGIRTLTENYLKLASDSDSGSAYPISLQDISSQEITQMSDGYLKQLVKTAGEADRITDKMPTNAFHIGLINALFPNATIIYTARNRLDICLSCYFQNFTSSHDFSFNLRNTGKFYREHARLMEFWREIFPGRIQTIEYEKLVENQEAETHRLVEEICGLRWEESCLQFHQNRRAVNTASLWQVRQPMYQKSVAKWKNYAAHLKPLFDELGMQDQSAA